MNDLRNDLKELKTRVEALEKKLKKKSLPTAMKNDKGKQSQTVRKSGKMG